MDGRLAWISFAPVKGLGLMQVDAADLGPDGIAENRRFFLLDERGRLVNGKTAGQLVQIRPSYSDADGVLSLTFPDGSVVASEVEVGDAVDGLFFGYPRPGHVVLGPFSDAISSFAGRPMSLHRADVGVAVDRMDGGTISLVTTAALGDFDQRRFRMLFGIDGVPAHAEDGWLEADVRIGDAVVRPLGVTGRCLVTSQNPDTGRPNMDMLEHIREHRPSDLGGEPLPFGVHGRVVTPGRVAVGDPVSV